VTRGACRVIRPLVSLAALAVCLEIGCQQGAAHAAHTDPAAPPPADAGPGKRLSPAACGQLKRRVERELAAAQRCAADQDCTAIAFEYAFRPCGESVRVFPISNWTELDVWEYLAVEQLEVPSIYFAHEREVFERDAMLYAMSEHVELIDGEQPFTASVRYRTVGDMSCTGAVRSTAADLDAVVAEIAATRITERGETRADDRATEAAMEDRKVAGYF
jgi:3'-phosphoadenosine 5'-phosphosulfate sulfotransferase (PAPS reductase)/FAD synthetase